MAKDREQTISDVLIFISQIDNIQEMRHQVLKLSEKLNNKKLEIVLGTLSFK